MAANSDNLDFGKKVDELEIIELKNFDTAFAVSDSLAAETKRRFMTLFVSVSETRMSGSSGTVSKAYNAKGEVFAIKRLLPPEANGQLPSTATQSQRATKAFTRSQVAAFYEEYRAQLQLSNMKGFPKLYGYGVADGEPIIVMEWVEGMTLNSARRLLPPGSRTRSINPKVVAQLGYGLFSILEGLDRMAERPVHRDISPSNIMLRTSNLSIEQQIESGNFDICLIDFGSATVVAPQNPNFTMTTNVWRNGTPEYAPPEMLTYDAPNVTQLRQSPSIDVYASCSILYELAVGYTPFQIGSHMETSPYRRKMDNDPLPLPADLGALGSAIMGGLAREQNMRLHPRALCDLCLAYLRGEAAPDPNAYAAAAAAPAPAQAFAIPPVADYETTHLTMSNASPSNTAGNAGGDSSSSGGKKVLVALAATVGAAIIIAIPYLIQAFV